MIIKFEAKSQRVKGLAFHPKRPWLLSSLHNGQIQLWDYRIGSMIDKFDGHEGPVRSVDFHQTQPLIVSGGDDYNIKVWNYKQRKCLFTLKGHLDYIRTTQFHSELPWIVSSCDDQTIRLWNWQNRSPLAILTGHSHYVMCAQFHPTKDLIVSCSLDQTLRIWDYSQIRKKFISSGAGKSGKHELYGNEVEIIAVLEGHDRGVNWCQFHPTTNLIVSGADDKKIKLWKFTETKAWEHDSLFGHASNVSCVAFHPKLNCIISNSEDKTTRIWCLEKKVEIDRFKRDNDRFWIINSHPEQSIFASGYDNGFVIMNLLNDRIPHFPLDSNYLAYGHRKQLKLHNYSKNSDIVLKNMLGSTTNTSMIHDNIVDIQYNSYDQSTNNQFLVGIKEKDISFRKYLLVTLESNIANAKETSKTFYGLQSIFVSKNKIALLRQDKEIEIFNIDLNQTSQPLPGLNHIEKIFQAPIGKLMVQTDEQIVLYDVNGKKVTNSISYQSEQKTTKSVLWNKNNSYFALACKKIIYIYTKSLQKICTFEEKFNIKSLIWTKENILLYTTINHIKYGIINGETGILKCIDQKLRAVAFENGVLITINPNGEVQKTKLESEEFSLKQALYEKIFNKTKLYMANLKQLGNSTIAYLYKKGYSGLAMNLVGEQKAKFSLAIDSGNLEVAYKTCTEVKDKEMFKMLGEEALRQGNHQIVEIALQNIRDFDKLSFLYLILGRMNKLEKMLCISQNRGDIMSRFNNSLFLGDVQERIRILAEVGQLNLAYLSAVTHGYEELAEPLRDSIENPVELLQQLREFKSYALVPPQPLVKDQELSPQCKRSWPHNFIAEEASIQLQSNDEQPQEQANMPNENVLLDQQDEFKDFDNEDQQQKADFNDDLQDEGEAEGKWGIDEEELDIPKEEQAQSEPKSNQNDSKNQFYEGENAVVKSAKMSQFAAELASQGMFEEAFMQIKKQLGIYNYTPLKGQMMTIYSQSSIYLNNIPFLKQSVLPIPSPNNKPYIHRTLKTLSIDIKSAYKLTTEGKFQEAVNSFRKILQWIPLLLLQSSELNDANNLIKICFEYIIALSCELGKKEQTSRSSELTAYMALCNMQPQHRLLALRSAMTAHYKAKNFIYSSYFAKRLIRLIETTNLSQASQQILQKAKDVLQACSSQGTNASKISFDEKWLFDDSFTYNIEFSSLKIIQEGSKCPFCAARYSQGQEGKICGVCQLGKIGSECMGIKTL